MKWFSLEENGYPKQLLILAAIFLVATGLCGMQALIANSSLTTDSVLIPLGLIELIVMLLSAGAIVLVLILWLASTLYGRFSKPQRGHTQKLFDSKDEEEK